MVAVLLDSVLFIYQLLLLEYLEPPVGGRDGDIDDVSEFLGRPVGSRGLHQNLARGFVIEGGKERVSAKEQEF